MRCLLATLVAAVMLGPAAAAVASEWGDIRPGISTTKDIRALYGAPTKSSKQKVESYETETWIYEGPQSPPGTTRLTIEFGLLQSEKFQPTVVRDFKLEPTPGAFTRRIVTLGWGEPDRFGRDGETDVFVYYEGLLVYFDETGQNAKLMVFTVAQPRDPADEPRSR